LDLPDHHLSYKSLREMLNFQAEGVMQELKEDLKKCKSLGILIDESEDSSKTSILLVYVRYWSRNKNKI